SSTSNAASAASAANDLTRSVKVTKHKHTSSAGASSSTSLPVMSGSPPSLNVNESDEKKAERDRNRDGDIEDIDCNAIDEHTRRTRLAAVISVASNALDVVSSDRAPYQMTDSHFARDD